MNIKTLLTNKERNAIANGISEKDFKTSSEYFEAIIKAENKVQDLKTKRVIVEYMDENDLIAHTRTFDDLFCMKDCDGCKFKKWAEGE